jgi:low-density lipoprotein receptor-related protein 1 (alpha-2-macroglobulin receptor)
MDGTNREVLAAKNVNGNASIYWPVSLTYCKEKRKLYWLDVLTHTIESINLVGVKIREQKNLGNLYSQSLTVLSNTIYIMDNLKNNINSLNADSTNINKDLKVFYRSPMKKSFLKSGDISFYNDHVESSQQMNCPGLWLNTPDGGVCLCGDGFSKNGVGSRCIPSKYDTSGAKISRECPELTFACRSGDECIDHYYVCDGTKDCTDGSDELDSTDGPCQKTCDFRCDGNKCIEFYQVCDSIRDCQDESDETVKACSNKTIDYNEYEYCDEFLCENFNCILSEQRCDGTDNCGDGSDEKECLEIDAPLSTLKTTEEEEEIIDESEIEKSQKTNRNDCKAPDYYCEANEKCIAVHQLCDGISDCPDNSDELGRCSERLCDKIVECQFFCHNAPNGYVCSCPQHMTLENDEKSCSEPKACDDFSACSQLCIQLNPSHIKCKCFHGYRLKEDNFTCESEHHHDPILLVSNRHILRGINLKSHKEVKNYYSISKNIIGIDFFYDRHTKSYEIVWSDITNDKIYLGKLRGDDLINIKPIVESDLSSTEAVAIDWIGKNVYWIDASLKQIEVATKDGLHRTTLISENISKPRSMAVDSRFGYLFWSDWDEKEPRIERSSLAGEERKSIFNLRDIGGEWPNGITLDYAKKRVYFLDAKSKEIHTIDYNGQTHRRIYKNPEYLYHPFAITIYENNLYWSDWRLNAVITANKFSGSNVSIFYQATIQPFDVKIMHPSRQPWDFNGNGGSTEITSPCENSNCSHLCLLSMNNTYKCACPYMMRLSEHNPFSCEKIKDIMFYTTNKSEIRAIELDHPYSTAISTIYHISQIVQPDHITIHPKEKRIYWSDIHLKEIKSVKLSTSITPSDQKIETILDTDIDKVHGFTVDWNSDLLFFSQKIPTDDDADDDDDNGPGENESISSGGHRMLVSNLKGEYLAKVLDNVNAIFSITIASKL